jgi:hypothetical protein
VRAYPEESDRLVRQQRDVVSEKVAANEEIRETQVRLGLGDGRSLPFLCECDDVSCRSLVRMTAQTYAETRAVPTRRIVADRHPCDGSIISRGPGYVVVEA